MSNSASKSCIALIPILLYYRLSDSIDPVQITILLGAEAQERHRYVDMCVAPGIHPTHVEFMRRLKSADSQHFTRNMDVVGTISEEDEKGQWEKSHLIGVRTDRWKRDAAEVAEKLRVLKKRRRAGLRKQIKRSGRLNAKQDAKLQAALEQDQIMQMESEEIDYLSINPHPLADNIRFLDLLTLFGCTIGYHRAMRRSIQQSVSACFAGDWHQHVIEDEELRLRHNGRAAAWARNVTPVFLTGWTG